MARQSNKLTARAVATIARPGRHSDGGGLYLVVDPSGARRWLFMFRQAGKLREMGLGGIGAVSLADARDKAESARKSVAAGRDPIGERKHLLAKQRDVPTFGAFAEQLVPELAKGFRNAKHTAQWTSTLRAYATPIWSKPIDGIGTADVLACLAPIWTTKAETASRVRGRIERVLDAAKARGLRSGENAAAWKGNLAHLLARQPKLSRGHHAAMPFGEVPAFVAELRERKAVAALALEFTILTAARTGEVIGATWPEIDLAARAWVIPAKRMKAGREHRVPLTDRALAILAEATRIRVGAYVFPSRNPKRPLSPMALTMLLRRMGRTVTSHGFRSSFRDWSGEATPFPRELAELALAHVVGDETERAYRRSDALEKRRAMMDAWSAFVGRGKQPGNVVDLPRRA